MHQLSSHSGPKGDNHQGERGQTWEGEKEAPGGEEGRFRAGASGMGETQQCDHRRT